MKVSNNGDAFMSELLFKEPISTIPNTSYTLSINYLMKCDVCGVMSIKIQDGMDFKYFNISGGFKDRWNQSNFYFFVNEAQISVLILNILEYFFIFLF
jgi:hypothetical protein